MIRDAMTATKKLSDRRAIFVAEYRVDGNATRSAIAAGFSAKSAKFIGHKLLKEPAIASAIEKQTAKALDKLEVTVQRVLKERARLAFFDARKLFDEDGAPIPVHKLDDDTAAAVAGFKPTELGMELKLADKAASLTALEKHLGMYKEEGGDAALSIHIHL